MSFSMINSFLAPMGLITAGMIMKLSKYEDRKRFGPFKKYWYLFVFIGLFLFTFRMYKQVTG